MLHVASVSTPCYMLLLVVKFKIGQTFSYETSMITSSFHFVSAVHIWFISYIINTHFFHGNIWTHNWPAPNVSGFIAQLVEHRTGNREVTGSNPVEVLDFFQASQRNCINRVNCDDHFFISTPYIVGPTMLGVVASFWTYVNVVDWNLPGFLWYWV